MKIYYLATFALLLFVGVISCKESKKVPDYIPEVTAAKAQQQDVTEYLYFTGNTQSPQSVEFRARVSGTLTKVFFKDGDFVKAGDELFEIEPETYEAKLNLAQASVVGAEAELLRANLEYQRQVELLKKAATSASDVDRWRAQRDAAQASLDEAKANVTIAAIQYGYTKIIAPFDGRMDKSNIDMGNLVGSGEATLLSVIRKTDPMYAYFSINEKDLAYARAVRRANKENGASQDEMTIPVELQAEGESNYPHQGVMDFGSTSVDEKTGSLLLRASFSNPRALSSSMLIPGMFVKLRIPLRKVKGALLVPERIVGTEQQGRFVYVLDNQNIVRTRSVKVSFLVGEMRVINDGISADDLVVVNGIQRIQPGIKVNPVSVK